MITLIPDAQEALEEACSTSISVLARSSVKEGLTRMEPKNKSNESLFYRRREKQDISDRRIDLSVFIWHEGRKNVQDSSNTYAFLPHLKDQRKNILVRTFLIFNNKLKKIHLKRKKYFGRHFCNCFSSFGIGVSPEISSLHQTKHFSSIEQDKLELRNDLIFHSSLYTKQKKENFFTK